MANNYTSEIIYMDEKSPPPHNQQGPKSVRIIHFNDVYNIESREKEPVGGAARFIQLLDDLIESRTHTVVLFSGDALSPSSISMVVKGKQMIDILNECHIACACLGNHEFDFGLDVLLERIASSNFPWLISNALDAETKRPLGDVQDRHIIEINGLKIGVIGLVEEEWMATLSTINFDDIIYESYVYAGKRLANELKQNDKCDLVIALTHMRWHNDKHLASCVPEIDLILGGHDHDYEVNQINNKWVVKSGTDFRDLSTIDIRLDDQSKRTVIEKIEHFVVDSRVPEKLEATAIVNAYLTDLSKELEVVLGQMNVDLEGRFSYGRTQETNLGNFICDIMLCALNADCAFINSGSLRSDCLHQAGDFSRKDLKKILPHLDENVVIGITGAKLHQALENSVSKYPDHEGRFLQVGGIKFAFDPSKPIGSRVDPRLIQVQDEYIDMNREYSVATKLYLSNGKDGFECLSDCPILIDGENVPYLYVMVENHFKAVQKVKKSRATQRFRSSIVPLVLMNRLIDGLVDDPLILPPASFSPRRSQLINFQSAAFLIGKVISHKHRITNKQRKMVKKSDKYQQMIRELEAKAIELAPCVQDRIVLIRDAVHYDELLKARVERLARESEPPTVAKLCITVVDQDATDDANDSEV